MKKKIWIRKEISGLKKFLYGLSAFILLFSVWFALTSAKTTENRVISRNVLPNPIDIIKTFPSLIKGTGDTKAEGFIWKKSLFYAVWMSLKREIVSFLLVVALALPIGVLMSVSSRAKAFINPTIVIGTFIPIAALIPLTQAIFGIGEFQKIAFLTLGMIFVLVGLVMKEMDEVDDLYLDTAYTLGFSQIKTILFVIIPTALPRVWKHLSAVFGLGWGYIIFAEMINSGGGETINGIGWLFIARQRRFQIADMYAIFFIIIFFAFFFSYIFKISGWALFKHERDKR
ncbi:MAG: ABC transporter permease subunit [Spirochaetes bacterium]|nr:ABC transporter permease subunit [Spirochaetota bacterium]